MKKHRIFRPRRFFAALMAGTSVFLAACQPTPETEIISQKEDIQDVIQDYTQAGDASGDTGYASGSSGDTSGQQGQTLAQRLGVPESISFEITSENGGPSITADHIPVEFPQADRAGAATVVRADLTDEQLWTLVEGFTQGVELYEPLPSTKEDLQENIEQMQEEINAIRESGSEEEQGQISELEEIIRFRQSFIESAPSRDSLEYVPMSKEWENDEFGMERISGQNNQGDMTYSVYATKDASTYMVSLTKEETSISKHASLCTEAALHGMSGGMGAKGKPSFENKICACTDEEAVQTALDFLSEQGIATEDLMARKIEPVIWCDFNQETVSEGYVGYKIDLCRSVGDILQTFTDDHIWYMDINGEVAPENEGRLPYDYESLTITVTDDGIVDFYWTNPMEITQVLSEDVALKSFDEIQKIMEQHALMAYESYSLDSYENEIPLKLGKVTFGMMRVQNPDSDGEYTLVPVWDVFAYLSDGTLSASSMMTINAMDGSIISRNTGY